MQSKDYPRYELALLMLFLVIVVALGVSPRSRVDWALENMVEWIGGAYLGDDTSRAFVGAQNDPWDSKKDMALAVAGAFVSLLASLCRTSEKAAGDIDSRKESSV